VNTHCGLSNQRQAEETTRAAAAAEVATGGNSDSKQRQQAAQADNHVYSVAEYYGPMCLSTCGSVSKYIKFICRTLDQRGGGKV